MQACRDPPTASCRAPLKPHTCPGRRASPPSESPDWGLNIPRCPRSSTKRVSHWRCARPPRWLRPPRPWPRLLQAASSADPNQAAPPREQGKRGGFDRGVARAESCEDRVRCRPAGPRATPPADVLRGACSLPVRGGTASSEGFQLGRLASRGTRSQTVRAGRPWKHLFSTAGHPAGVREWGRGMSEGSVCRDRGACGSAGPSPAARELAYNNTPFLHHLPLPLKTQKGTVAGFTGAMKVHPHPWPLPMTHVSRHSQ